MRAHIARSGWLVVAATMASASATADTFTVPGDYTFIQDAIDACSSGDEVVVADGTWTGHGNTDLHFSDEAITLRSASGNPLMCIIDAQNLARGFVITNHEINQVTIEGFTIRNGWSISDGGAIYIDQASPAFDNCRIENSFAEFDGGGAYVSEGGPEFTNCRFQSNSVFDDGGGLFNDQGHPSFIGCVFDGNSAADDGGAIASFSEFDFTITQTDFESNTAPSGGAIYHARAPGAATITIDGCSFVANSTPGFLPGHGGAIYVSESNLDLVDSHFDSNNAQGHGGAIVLSGSLTADNTDFDSNYGVGGGGAIALELAGATLTACDFDSNWALDADTGGGALYITESDVTLTGCDFLSNTAQRHGGAIYHTDGTLELTTCTFTENETLLLTEDPPAQGGGAIANRIYGELTMIDCTLTANVSAASAGALLNLYSSSADIRGCTFLDNEATGSDGGAIDSGEVGETVATLLVLDTRFEGNQVLWHGGAINGGTGIVSGCTFVGNHTLGYGHPAGSGGAIAGTVMVPSIFNSRFHGNQAGAGGAIVLEKATVAANCVFTGNHAEGQGGAVYLNTSGTGPDARLVNCTLRANTAGEGSAISGWGNKCFVENCIVWDNGPDPIEFVDSGTQVFYSNVEGGFPGPTNIDADPMFLDPDGPDGMAGTEDDDLRLSGFSPCVDAADNTTVPPDLPDLDDDGDATEPLPLDLSGAPRFVDRWQTPETGVPDGVRPPVDMGSSEWQPSCPGDLDGDGDVDTDDLLAVLGGWGANLSGDVTLDGETDVDDLLIVLGAWGPCP